MPCSVAVGRSRRRSPVGAWGMWGAIALATVVCGAPRARAADVEGGAILSLPGGTLAGRLVAAPPPAEGASPTIRWQSPAFAGPFEFPLEQIGGIAFLREHDAPNEPEGGGWQLELNDGDLVVGRLVSIDEMHVGMSIGPLETPVAIAVGRGSVRRISTAAARTTSVWNGGLDRGRTSAESHWRKSSGGIASSTAGAMVRFDAGDVERMRYDVVFSWEEPPRVRLGFGEFRSGSAGVGGGQSLDPGYRVELTTEGIVVVRDEARPDGSGRADLASCGVVPEKGLSLSVFIDRKAGRMVVVRPGESVPLADLSIDPIVPVAALQPNAIGPGRGPTDSEILVGGHGLQLDLLSGAVVLERLRMTPWRGSLPGPDDDSTACVELLDGTAIAGRVTGLADDGRAVAVVPAEVAGAPPQTVPLDTVAAIRFAGAAAPPSPAEGESPRRVRISDRYGSSLRGDFLDVAEGRVTISHTAVDAPVSLPIALLEGIAPDTSSAADPPLPGRVGRLVLDQVPHDGCLVPIAAEGTPEGSGTVGWLPRGSLVAQPLEPAADGSQLRATIRYDDPASDESVDDRNGWIGVTIGQNDGKAAITEVIPGGPLQRSVAIVPPARIHAVAPRGDGVFVATKGLSIEDVMYLVQGRAGTEIQLQITEGALSIRRNISLVRGVHPFWGRNRERLREVLEAQERLLSPAPKKGDDPVADLFPSVVILETGESVEGRVESIGEGGLRLIRQGTEPVTIPPSEIKAVELVRQAGGLISPEKFRSLTTLPRSQRHLPPTHLVRSLEGDYLRGRLERMDGENLRIALDADPRGKPLAIPRREVARVIWLHPESLDDSWRPPVAAPAPGLPIEAVNDRGWRLRIGATGIEGNVLIGAHPVLGSSRIDLESIDRLLLGGELEETPRLPPYGRWQMQPAAEPRNLPKKPSTKP